MTYSVIRKNILIQETGNCYSEFTVYTHFKYGSLKKICLRGLVFLLNKYLDQTSVKSVSAFVVFDFFFALGKSIKKVDVAD